MREKPCDRGRYLRFCVKQEKARLKNSSLAVQKKVEIRKNIKSMEKKLKSILIEKRQKRAKK